jgi:hypothetical protein
MKNKGGKFAVVVDLTRRDSEVGKDKEVETRRGDEREERKKERKR